MIKNVRISILLSLILLSSCLIYISFCYKNYSFWLTDKFHQTFYSREWIYNFAKFIKNKNQSDDHLNLIGQLRKEIEIYKYENNQLKNLLNFLNNKIQRFDIVTNKIVITPNNQELIVNLPTEKLKIDQIVVNQNGFVGKVYRVHSNFARIMFVANKKFKIPVISTQTLNRFIASGDGYYIKPFFLSEKLKDGELIVSAINEERIPVGFFRQETNSIEPVNVINKLDYVSILIDD